MDRKMYSPCSYTILYIVNWYNVSNSTPRFYLIDRFRIIGIELSMNLTPGVLSINQNFSSMPLCVNYVVTTNRFVTRDHFLVWINLNTSIDKNNIHYKAWDEKTYPFPNINGKAVEVWECISNFIDTLLGMWLLIRGAITVNPYWKWG